VAEAQTFEMRSGSLLSLQARPGPWLERLAPGLSQLPPGRRLDAATPQGQALWLRLGPEQWWCWRAQASEPPLQTVQSAAGDEPHAGVELGDAYPACVLGASAQALLSCGCDLDFERLPADFAGRTRLAGFSVVLARLDSAAWCIWVEASLAHSLQQWLARTQALLSRP